MLTALLPFPGSPDAVPGVHVHVSEPVVRSRNASSVYDEARVLLDRLTAGGAFSVPNYEVVRDALILQPTSEHVFRTIRAALAERMDVASFKIVADIDPETNAHQLVIVAQSAQTPEAAAETAWTFYRDWLAEHPGVRIGVSIRPAPAM